MKAALSVLAAHIAGKVMDEFVWENANDALLHRVLEP